MNNYKTKYEKDEIVLDEPKVVIVHSDKLGKVVVVRRDTSLEKSATGLDVDVLDFQEVFDLIKDLLAKGVSSDKFDIYKLEDMKNQEFIITTPGSGTSTSITADDKEFIIQLYKHMFLDKNFNNQPKGPKKPDNILYNMNTYPNNKQKSEKEQEPIVPDKLYQTKSKQKQEDYIYTREDSYPNFDR